MTGGGKIFYAAGRVCRGLGKHDENRRLLICVLQVKPACVLGPAKSFGGFSVILLYWYCSRTIIFAYCIKPGPHDAMVGQDTSKRVFKHYILFICVCMGKYIDFQQPVRTGEVKIR